MKGLLFLLLILPLNAQILGAFETFTEEDNAVSWGFYNYETDSAIDASWKLPDTPDAEAYGAFTGASGVSLFADAISSGSYLVGDYTSAEIDIVNCDIYVEDLNNFLEAEFYILASGVFYYSDPYIVSVSGWSNLTVSLSKDQWYIYDNTNNVFIPTELTSTILSDVTEIGVNYFPSSAAAEGKLVAVDNFALLPDLDPPTLNITQPNGDVGVSFERKAGISYDLQMSETLLTNDWSGLDADTSDIRGEGLYEIFITARPKSFFRVTTYPLLLQLP